MKLDCHANTHKKYKCIYIKKKNNKQTSEHGIIHTVSDNIDSAKVGVLKIHMCHPRVDHCKNLF